MNGARGAKGSINDRLISLMYRMRYKKYKLKKENYTVDKKIKEIEYFDNLDLFNEDLNPDHLDDFDKSTLENVEFRTRLSVEKKKTGSNQIINIDFDDIELASSYTEYVDLKNEKNKVEDERTILEEVTDFINKSRENLDEIKKQLDIINIRTKQKLTYEEELKLKQEYIKLREKINKLKKQYEAVKEKYDFSDFRLLENIKLMDSIEDYEKRANLEEIDILVTVCKEEIDRIKGITIINETKKRVGYQVDEKLADSTERKIVFNRSKELVSKTDNDIDAIKREVQRQIEISDDLYKRAIYFEKKVTKTVVHGSIFNFLSSMFKISMGTLTRPFTGKKLFGTMLGLNLINSGLKGLNNYLTGKEKLIVKYKYEDVERQIINAQDKLELTNLLITSNLDELEKLRENIKEKFDGYRYIISDYDQLFKKIDLLETNLKEKQEEIKTINAKYEEEKELNKQKIKRVGE